MRGAAALGLVVFAGAAGCSFGGNTAQGDPPDARPGEVIDASPGVVVDADPGAPDAMPPWDPAVCPPEYDNSHGASRYRIPDGKTAWLDAEHDCEDDTGGQWSHLVAVDSMDEWSWGKDALYWWPGSEWYHLGIVRDGGDPGAPWRLVTGGAPFMMWRNGEPNNGGSGEPVAVLDEDDDWWSTNPGTGGYIDVPVTATYRYICECDGLPPVNATY